jgi:hypothetical protein
MKKIRLHLKALYQNGFDYVCPSALKNILQLP